MSAEDGAPVRARTYRGGRSVASAYECSRMLPAFVDADGVAGPLLPCIEREHFVTSLGSLSACAVDRALALALFEGRVLS